MMGKLFSASLLLAASALVSAAEPPAGNPPPAAGPPGGGMGGMMRMSPEERFKMMDTNHDGKLSLEEMTAMRDRMRANGGGGGGPGGPGAGGGGGGGGMMQMSPEERFKMMDTNQDGSVSLDEYKAAMDRMRQMMGPGGQAAPASPPPAK